MRPRGIQTYLAFDECILMTNEQGGIPRCAGQSDAIIKTWQFDTRQLHRLLLRLMMNVNRIERPM
jgi:hypothetical protein